MNPIEDLQNYIADQVNGALNKARDAGQIEFAAVPDYVIEVPREKGHGDFASNVAMLLAREARKAPRQIAEIIVNQLNQQPMDRIARVEIAGPGFINFFLHNSWLYEIPALVKNLGADYGSNPPAIIKVSGVCQRQSYWQSAYGKRRGGAIGDSLAHPVRAVRCGA